MIGRAAARALAGDGWDVVAVSRSGALPEGLAELGVESGPGAQNARELFFVKRAVDGRRCVALAWRGESVFNAASVANLAELIRLAAAQPGDRILNGGDPDPPSTLEICHAIGDALG